MAQDIKLKFETDGDGAVAVESERRVFGYLEKVYWEDGDLADGVDATLSMIETPAGVEETILTLTDENNDKVFYPRHLVHSEAGAALTGTQGGDRVRPFLNGKPKLVIAQGGDTKSGSMTLIVVDQ